MIQTTIQEDNLRTIMDALQEIPAALRSGMFQAAQTMRHQAISRTPRYDDKLRTPAVRGRPHAVERWGQVQNHQGGFSFENPAFHTVILEEGAYPGVQDRSSKGQPNRTQHYGDGIYSTQALGGILGPLLEDEQLLEQIAEEIQRQILRRLEGVGA
jgi:hypothetical protein